MATHFNLNKEPSHYVTGESLGDVLFMNYLENFKGEAYASSIELSDELIHLPPQECRYAMLSNWNVDNDPAAENYVSLSGNDLYEDSGFEVYWGFGSMPVSQLFPSQTSGLIPVNNLNQICVKLRVGADPIVLHYAWFL